MKTRGRIGGLDALRGVAAAIVVFHHCFLVSAPLAAPYFATTLPSAGWFDSLLIYSPLHLIWAGTEAVYIFFILSGFVLALPSAEGRSPSWRSYYPQRAVRLYLPIAASVAAASLLLRVGDRTKAPWRSAWLNGHPRTVNVGHLAHDVTVIRGAGWSNSVLWSLQWEVIFSLLLPVFIIIALRLKKFPVGQLAAVLLLLLAGQQFRVAGLCYMGMFGGGVAMAFNLPTLTRIGARFGHLPTQARRCACLAGLVFLTARWWVPNAGVSGHGGFLADSPEDLAVFFICLLASALVVTWFATTDAGAAVGTLPVCVWLGERSFSLYLVHEPIVVTVAVLLGRRATPVTVLVIAGPIALLITSGFYRMIEAPSRNLSRRLGAERPHRVQLMP